MPHSLQPLIAFNNGEWSPRMDARIDLPGYHKACRKLRNMLALKEGGATRRPGTQFIAPGKQVIVGGNPVPATSRLVPFQFAPGTTFMLEFCHNGIRFYSNGAQVQVAGTPPAWVNGTDYGAGTFVTHSGFTWYTPDVIINSTIAPAGTPGNPWTQQTAYEVPTPYSATNFTAPNYWQADVFQLQVKQINDVVYIVHPSFPVYKLISYSNTNWVMQIVQFLTPAMLDENATDTTLTASAVTGTGVDLTATAPGWFTAVYYQPGNSIIQNAVTPANPGGLDVNYVCTMPHTSGVFLTDLANGLWRSTPIFQAGHVGSQWQLAYNRPNSQVIYDLTGGAGTSSVIEVIGTWEVITYGTWSADIKIEASYDLGVSWVVITTLSSRANANFNIQGTAVQTAQYRMTIANWTTETSAVPPMVTFSANNQFIYGLVKITSVTDAFTATCDVITPLFSTDATAFWSEGAWSAVRGYPTAVTVFQERVWYAGTTFQPQRLWGTQIDDIENFALLDQSQANYGLAFDLNAPGRGPIQWLTAQTDLVAGLAGAEWVISSGQPNVSISPTSIIALEHSANGSAPGLPGLIIGNAAVYVQRRGNQLQQILYSVFTQKYMSQDLMVLSQHLSAAGIKQFDFQQQFEGQAVLWCVCGDGSLISMTYDMNQQVFGWAKHTTGDLLVNAGHFRVDQVYTIASKGSTDFTALGATSNRVGTVFMATGVGSGTGTAVQQIDFGFLSVQVLYGPAGQDDEVWVSVQRGQLYASIERINPLDWQTSDQGQPDIQDAFYADCAITITSPTTNEITVSQIPAVILSRVLCASLNGSTSWNPLVNDGNGNYFLANYVPAAGNTDVIVIGLPINWKVQPMRLDDDMKAGPTQGIEKAVAKSYLRVVNSIGGTWANNQGETQQLPAYQITENSGAPPPFYPNEPLDVEIDVGAKGQYELDPQVTVQGSDPLPMTLLGILYKYDIGGQE